MEIVAKPNIKKFFLLFIIPFYCLFLIYFYYTFVPLIKSYQMILIPLLGLLVVSTVIKLKLGLLSFFFLLPVSSSLPYYFGLYENIPQAPVALILFLFFFLGYLINRGFQVEISSKPIVHPLQPFLSSFIALVLISGLITFLRYANFFPFLSDGLHELVVNVNGLRAGGARMSVIFCSLNLASGLLLSLILFPSLLEKRFRHQALFFFSLSFSLSIALAIFQFAFFPDFGQLPSWQLLRQFHGPYKDPNSFGFFLAAFLPLLFIFLIKYQRRALIFFLLILLSSLLLTVSGSRSAFLASFISTFICLILIFTQKRSLPRPNKLFILIFLSFFIFLFIFVTFLSISTLHHRIDESWVYLKEGLKHELFSGKLTLWSIALSMFSRYPFSGIGTGAYIVELPNFSFESGQSTVVTDSAENIIFQVMAELGIVGLLLLIFFIFKLISFIRKTWSKNKAILAMDDKLLMIGLIGSLVACGINLLFHSYIGDSASIYLFWFLFTMLISLLTSSTRYQSILEFEKLIGNSHENITEQETIKNKLQAKIERNDDNDEGAKTKREKKRLGRYEHRFLRSLALTSLFVLFICANFLVSLRSLSIPKKTIFFGWDQDFGFYDWEKDKINFDFRWAKKKAGLTLPIMGPEAVFLVHASHPDIAKNPVKIKIFYANRWFRKKTEIYSFELRDKDWHEIKIPLNFLQDKSFSTKDKLNLLNQVNDYKENQKSAQERIKAAIAWMKRINPSINLVFEADRDWNPGRVLKIPDPRNISFALGQVYFHYWPPFPEDKAIILKTISASDWTGTQGNALATSGEAMMAFTVEEDNVYLRLNLQGSRAFGFGPLFEVFIDDKIIARSMLQEENWTRLYLPSALKAGFHHLRIVFVNDYYELSLNQDRNLILGSVDIIRWP